jgi:hypothetical protein
MAVQLKGQFEAMGLAVIVLLVSLGMIFLLYFSFDDDSDVVERYGNEQTAQNVVNAMLDTTAENCQLDIADLIEDSVVWQRNPCGDSLMKVREARTRILDETLTRRDINYNFTILRQDGTSATYIDSVSTCNARQTQNDAPGRRTLTFYPAPQKAIVILYICYE